MKVLEDLAGRSKTTKPWVDVVIKPVFIMMKFIRTGRERDWLLNLVNVHEHCMKYEHVVRHMPGMWTGIWSDMYIETTFVRCCHMMSMMQPRGCIIDITVMPETFKTRILSLYI